MRYSIASETDTAADVFHHSAYRVHPTGSENECVRRSAAKQLHYYDS